MMTQWHACKEQAGDALLFFRMGDFYEAFYEDAEVMAEVLELTLTKRQEVPMAGVPWHSAEGYIDKLVARGFKVAVAEQTEDPKLTKGLVNREVVRVVTPGTSSQVAEKSNNYFVALAQQGAMIGLAALDLSTGEFRVTELENKRELLNELARLAPTEILAAKAVYEKFAELSTLVTVKPGWHFDHEATYETLAQHFAVKSLDGLGLKGMVSAIKAAGALLEHLSATLHLDVKHITAIHPYSTGDYVALDQITQRNLELVRAMHEGQTLLSVLDRTQTPMGGRLLKQWVLHPLLSPMRIADRQSAVEQLLDIVIPLKGVRDLERLVTKVSTGSATPRDLVALKSSLERVPQVRATLQGMTGLLAKQAERLENLHEVAAEIGRCIVDEPPARLSDGNVIREGFCPDLDELRALSRDSKSWLANYQTELRERFEIKTLKVGFNRVFGYFLEVSRGQADRMPDTFQRRQTLVNSERFISPELKEYESKILSAEERMSSLETRHFNALRATIAQHAQPIIRTARALATIDALASLACVARERGYARPIVDESDALEIIDGRHPVIEAATEFVANDTQMNCTDSQLILITGPNMAGKSTYIRQVALIALMAQIGSFVPATSAHIGAVDKIFTRIGASDDLSRGQSTFMVEMSETANILNNATPRSLVILDEIGRGTSTYDGISIAWSVAEHLLTVPNRKARTLFATHYFELTALEEQLTGARNYSVAVRESDDEVVFLHKIVPGPADRSYGIHVAKLAGLPLPAIARAKQILARLEKRKSARKPTKAETQLSLFS